MKTYLWDTGALSLFFANQSKTVSIMKKIFDKKCNGIVPTIVLAEFYYKSWHKFGEKAAQMRIINLRERGLQEVQFDSDDIYKIGGLKVRNNQLSIVDSIILTLSKKHKATILSTDTPLTKITGYNIIKLNY